MNAKIVNYIRDTEDTLLIGENEKERVTRHACCQRNTIQF